MLLKSCFFVAVAVAVLFTVIVYKNKKNFQKSTRLLLVGILLVITILIFPVYRESYGILTSALFSVLYGLRALAGCQSVDLTHKIVVEGWLYPAYYTLEYLSFIIAPIFSSSFLIGIFGGNLMDFIRFTFIRHMPWYQEIHVFSHLNETSLSISRSISQNQKKYVRIIFCHSPIGAKEKDSSSVKKAREFGAILLDLSETDLDLIKKKNLHFYEIDSVSDYNLNNTMKLIEKYRDHSTLVQVSTLCSGSIAELLFDSLNKGSVRVKLMDEVKYSCYGLLDRVPLFTDAKNNKMSILIVGADALGMEMLKAVIWCGQVSGYELEINVLDMNAEEREKTLLKECPNLELKQYGIHFIQCNVLSKDFEDVLYRYCNDTTYVIVMMGNDQLNIETGVYLRQHFLRKDREKFENKPVINIRVREKEKYKQIEGISTSTGDNYGLKPFGSVDTTFTIENLLGSSLEKRAVLIHRTYYNLLDSTDQKAIDKAMESYYAKEYNQKSSYASGLHMKYKLFSAGIDADGNPITKKQIEQFEEYIKVPENLEKIAKLEHLRWNAFMITQGFSFSDENDVIKYRDLAGKPTHIHNLAKLHPALVDWDFLDKMDEKISAVMGKNMNFKQSDFYIVEQTPAILRLCSEENS